MCYTITVRKIEEGGSMHENMKKDYSLYLLLFISIVLMFINFGCSFHFLENTDNFGKVGTVNAEVMEKTESREQV